MIELNISLAKLKDSIKPINQATIITIAILAQLFQLISTL